MFLLFWIMSLMVSGFVALIKIGFSIFIKLIAGAVSTIGKATTKALDDVIK